MADRDLATEQQTPRGVVVIHAALREPTLAATPGHPASTRLKVVNDGNIVDRFSFQALGDAAPWTTFEPPNLPLYPGKDGEVTVTFTVPRTADVPAGHVPFGIRIVSHENPETAAIEEGALDISPFAETSAELRPATSKGRLSGHHDIAVDNRGNMPIAVDFVGGDRDEQLRFRFRIPTEVGPGTAAFGRVRVHPRHRIWRGSIVTHRFGVTVQPEGNAPIALDGTYLQEPIIPKWAPKAALAAIAAIAVLAAIWFLVLKPTIKSTAQSAAKKQVESSQNAATLTPKAGGNKTTPSSVPASGNGSTTGTTTVVTSPPLNPGAKQQPIDGTATIAGSGKPWSYQVPQGQNLSITDVVVSNPKADSGTLHITKNGLEILGSPFTLDDFRSPGPDLHFVDPIVFNPGSTLTVVANCPPGDCSPNVYFVGHLTPVAP